MAETQPVVGQKLRFEEGELLVLQSFTSPNGLLHMTAEGFFFGPGKPLTDPEIADKLPEPFKTQANEFVASQAAPPPGEGEGGITRSTDDEAPAKVVPTPYPRRR